MAAVHRLTLPQRMLLGFGLLLFRLLSATLRVRLTDRARALFAGHPRRHLFLLWHNRLALALMAFQRVGKDLPLTGLVSASGDGAILTEVMHAFGIGTARGSSSRRAMEATRELLEALDAERNIVITPDGPRGPCYVLKEGTAQIAASPHVRVVALVGLTVSRAWTLRSWDRFIVPQPFATLTLDLQETQAPRLTTEALEEDLKKLNP